MHIWDTAGQEEFSKLTRNYYAGKDKFAYVSRIRRQHQSRIWVLTFCRGASVCFGIFYDGPCLI